ncbi:MAG TPA: hypothetical protein ENF67_00360, partial [Candidatus Pacearchaeota archaeon]|nr:hypothetical protein [Candidatus Pacearchaeota archaeon]
MLSAIEEERRRAEHLFYVSLKYTKTSEVIVSLLERWCSLIDLCISLLLKKAKKNKKIKKIPEVPKLKIEETKRVYKEDIVKEVLELYGLLRKLPKLKKYGEHEFRKNVCLVIDEKGKKIVVNMEKLKEWNKLISEFLKYVRHVK